MNLRSKQGGARIGSGWTALAVASTVLLLSPVAQAQHMHGSGGMQRGGHIAGAPHFNRGAGNFHGGRHNGVAARGFHHHRNFSSVVVIGSAGFLYPYVYPSYTYVYPYAYDPSLATPAYFCDAAGVYYPYVTTCDGGWRVVPAPPGQIYPVPPQ